MAAGVIKKKKKITSKFYTTVTTAEYYGWYYGNVDGIMADASIIGVIVWDINGTPPTLI